MTISLRPEGPPESGDSSFLRRLILDTVTDELGAQHWPEPMRTHLLEIQYSSRRNSILAAFPFGQSQIIQVDGADAGWLFVAHGDEEIRIAEIMVQAAHRGKGVATAVLTSVLAEASRAGKPARLRVNVTNGPAIRLYERIGFRRIGGDEMQHVMEYARP